LNKARGTEAIITVRVSTPIIEIARERLETFNVDTL